jgi:hypothetical protein
MRSKRTDSAASDSISVIQAPPLGLGDLRFVRDALVDVGPQWCAELEGICADVATIVIVPEDGDDATGPSFVVSREGFGYRLDQVRWDHMQDVGAFATLADVMTAVQRQMATGLSAQHEASLTLH